MTKLEGPLRIEYSRMAYQMVLYTQTRVVATSIDAVPSCKELGQDMEYVNCIACDYRCIDTCCALQALRHLYVLATESRCVEAIDVDSRQSVYVPLTVNTDMASGGAAQQVSVIRSAYLSDTICRAFKHLVLMLAT